MRPLKVLLTGARGQLARSLLLRAQDNTAIEFLPVGRDALDLESPSTIGAAIGALAPDVVLNTAAFTAVDDAEREVARAFRVNAAAAGEIAAAARLIGARIVHISTDYVFDGEAASPYGEDAAVRPLNVYGRSKLLGEEQVRRENGDHVIVRTAWLYSRFGANFVKAVIARAGSQATLDVVSDQLGSPTSAPDLADGLLAILTGWGQGGTTGLGQTYHLAGAGTTSRFELARAICRFSGQRGGPDAIVRPVRTQEIAGTAIRPAFSALECGKFHSDFGFRMPAWRASLAAVVGAILHPSAEPRGDARL